MRGPARVHSAEPSAPGDGAGDPCPNDNTARPVAASPGKRLSRGGGRRPGKSSTRTEILAAALELFAAKGYSGTTMRGIARQAQVDPALVHHFFNSKDGLFQEAVSSRIDMSTLLESRTDEKPEAGLRDRGARIARAFLSLWEDESTRPALIAVLRAGLSQEAAAKAFLDRIEAALASWLGRIAPEETERAPVVTSLVSAQLVGLALLRYVVAVEPLASLDFEELVARLAPALEAHLDRLPRE
ncbi:TetR family transcriptional regulator [Streptomyces sp. NPDC060053]|uniref:TetR/AcrR family transcriptional regulator n=1 Tax=Streptomyces sp. NPDC060053 TaxID=3347047 RepID=UPI00367DF7DA